VRRREENLSVVSVHHHDEHRHASLLRTAESVLGRGYDRRGQS
jgi:hypothetical protein